MLTSPSSSAGSRCHTPGAGLRWSWTSPSMLARSVLECLPRPTLKYAPVSPVSTALACQHTGTGHTCMSHAHLSVVGDASAEPLSEDLRDLLRASLRLELDIWLQDLRTTGSPQPLAAYKELESSPSTCHSLSVLARLRLSLRDDPSFLTSVSTRLRLSLAMIPPPLVHRDQPFRIGEASVEPLRWPLHHHLFVA